MIRRFYNAVVVPTLNFCFRWLGWTGVCVGTVVLIVALSIRHDATARHAPTTPHGGYELTILSPTPSPHPAPRKGHHR